MNTPFFDSLIDNFGIWQHTDGQTIYKGEGYALDDAARGLLLCLALQKTKQAEVLFKYIKKSCRGQSFYGFATDKHKFLKYPASEDAIGEAIWALGFAYSLDFHRKEIKEIIETCWPTVMKFEHMRGYAYALLGAVYFDNDLSKKLADKLLSFFAGTDDKWLWPEPVMTYGNGIVPYALLRYGLVSGDRTISQFGLKVCQFLESKCELGGRILGPIGNEGWLAKSAMAVPEYSQQPIDTAYMIWAWLAAYQCFGQEKYFVQAKKWLEWFDGHNIKKERMYDPLTLKCYDGIDRGSVHYNSGAESNICLLLSLLMLDQKTTI